MSEQTSVTATQLVRGVLRTLPRGSTAVRGLVKLALNSNERQESIGSLAEHWAKRQGDHTAILYRDQRISYADFNGQANRWAAYLRELGVGKGTSVGILMENRPELLSAVLATVKLGAAAGMFNYNQRGEVLSHSIGLIKPTVLLVGNECLEALDSARKLLPEDLLDKTFWLADAAEDVCPKKMADFVVEADRRPGNNPSETASVTGGDPAFYIFTSGTTGMPKASIMSHGRWLKSAAGMGLASLQMRNTDVFYCPLPFYHNNALTVSWGAVLSSGAALVMARKFSASRFWDEVGQYGATAFCYIGELCRYLLAQPSSAREREHQVRICVGNGLRPELWKPFRERFGIDRINEFYGASESNLAFTNTFDIEGSCGYCPLPFSIVQFNNETETPVRDARGRLVKVRRGGVGLLISEVTKRTPFDGYTDPAASEKKLLRNVFKHGDCYFNTGDLVRDMGFKHIQFVDRVGDTFRWKGENVATTEVERAFDGSKGIEEAVVYGVKVPGGDGRAGMAAITLAKGAKLDGKKLAEHLTAALPSYAVPVFIRIRQQHDTTGTFKARKVELKQEGWADSPEPVHVLVPKSGAYKPLNDKLRKLIEASELRL